jgi:RNA polymerase sigma-70 factor (ECF subfamily)
MEGRTGVPVMADAEPQTSKTLLSRLHTWRDQTAWRQFFAAYQPLLDRWARTSLRNPADVQDLTQTLWFELARRVRSFQYDSSGSFRGWLRSLYRSRLSDFLKSEERRRNRERMAAQPVLELTASCLSFQTDRSEQTERSRQAAALAEKSQRIQAQIRQKVSAKSWTIFEQIAVHGMEIAEVARQHDMRYAAAFAAFSRVRRMLREAAAAETSE